LAEEFEEISNPRGKGLFCSIDLPDTESRDALKKECLKNQLMILGCGTKTLRFRPPLTIQKEHIDEGIDILKESLKAILDKKTAKL
jgi:L-lysine 6-transaminase